MPYLHDGSRYQTGQGLRMAEALPDRGEPHPLQLAQLRKNYIDSGYDEGFGTDVVVADLIVRRIITDRQEALAVLAMRKGDPA